MSLRTVRVAGVRQISKQDVLCFPDLAIERPLRNISVTTVKKHFQNFPWAKNVSVRKMYPDTVLVAFQEHRAIACILEEKNQAEWVRAYYQSAHNQANFRSSVLWLNNFLLKSSQWVSDTGDIIDAPALELNVVPVVWGTNALKDVCRMVQFLKQQSQPLCRQVLGLQRLPSGRWDLWLTSGLKVRLPKAPSKNALAMVHAFLKKTTSQAPKTAEEFFKESSFSAKKNKRPTRMKKNAFYPGVLDMRVPGKALWEPVG